MSAYVSSPIFDVLGQVGSSPADPAGVPAGLLDALAVVNDPRARRGVRHRFVAVLAVGVCAVLAGARTFTAVAE